MPQVSLIPFPDPQQNARVGWPAQKSNLTVGGAFDQNLFVSDTGVVAGWQASIGAGANTMILIDDVVAALFSTSVERAFTPFALIKPRVTGLAPGFIGIEQQRVFRLQFLMRAPVGVFLDRASGLQFSPTNVLGNSWTQAGGAAFGIVGDGLGQWEYIQSNVGAFPGNITAAQTIPISTDLWTEFDFELINSTDARPATMSLFVNGAFVLSKNFTTFAVPDTAPLPNLSEIVDANKYIIGVRAATAATGLWLGPLTVQMGRFTRAGLELLS